MLYKSIFLYKFSAVDRAESAEQERVPFHWRHNLSLQIAVRAWVVGHAVV